MIDPRNNTMGSALQREPAHGGPRDRLLRDGAMALSDLDLLTVCLGTGTPGRPAPVLAGALLADFGGLAALLQAPVPRLLAAPGLGPAKVALLKAVPGLSDRVAVTTLPRHAALTDSRAVIRYLRAHLAGYDREVFACLFLDTRHQPLGFEKLFFGTLDRAHVHPRELVKRALSLNAGALVLAHNHPSGVAEPSPSDIALTTELRALLERLEIRLLDHIVVSHSGGVSMAERGLI